MTAPKTPMSKGAKFAALTVFFLAAFSACSDKKDTGTDTADDTAAPAEAAAPVDPKTKIADYAIDDLTPSDYPKIYKVLGKAGAAEAKRGAYAAAYRVAKSADCDRVDNASITMSSTKKHQEFFVNCANAKQWRFKASELKDSAGKWYTAENAPVVGLSATDIRKQELADLQTSAPGSVPECEELLKQRLKHPASADFHSIMGAANFINPNDERAVQIDFEAKNGLGNELTYTGQCVFHKNGKVSVDIFDR